MMFKSNLEIICLMKFNVHHAAVKQILFLRYKSFMKNVYFLQ